MEFINVNDAFVGLVGAIHNNLVPVERHYSRNGGTIRFPVPVVITYLMPQQRVLFNEARDANPFFHLYEALWMLAGRNDLAPLQYYVSNFGQFSDDGQTLNGAYGYRWRCARYYPVNEEHVQTNPFIKDPLGNPIEKGGYIYRTDPSHLDQLSWIVEHLKKNPNSRRAVLDMWNVEDDLLKVDTSKDVCCNLNAVFKLREIPGTCTRDHNSPDCPCPPHIQRTVLDMTVFNRSNDLILGTLGANVVHFSFLQEYMAARLGASVGSYHQVSADQHTYTERWNPEAWLNGTDPKRRTMHSPRMWSYEMDVRTMVPLVRSPEVFDSELPGFVESHRQGLPKIMRYPPFWKEPFLQTVAQPAMLAYHFHKAQEYDRAIAWSLDIAADDWRIACHNWIKKRQLRHLERQNDQVLKKAAGAEQ